MHLQQDHCTITQVGADVSWSACAGVYDLQWSSNSGVQFGLGVHGSDL
jgi:hypothetical protein